MYIRSYKRKYNEIIGYGQATGCYALYFQLVKSYRDKKGKSRKKFLSHLGKIVVKDGFTEKYSKRLFFLNLRTKTKKLNLSRKQYKELIKNIENKIPQEKEFEISKLPFDFKITEYRYRKYLRNHTWSQLFDKVYPWDWLEGNELYYKKIKEEEKEIGIDLSDLKNARNTAHKMKK